MASSYAHGKFLQTMTHNEWGHRGHAFMVLSPKHAGNDCLSAPSLPKKRNLPSWNQHVRPWKPRPLEVGRFLFLKPINFYGRTVRFRECINILQISSTVMLFLHLFSFVRKVFFRFHGFPCPFSPQLGPGIRFFFKAQGAVSKDRTGQFLYMAKNSPNS